MKKKGTQRKGKKDWRKNCDVDEVEEKHREVKIAARTEEALASLDDSALFLDDHGPKVTARRIVDSDDEGSKGLSKIQSNAVNKLASAIESKRIKVTKKKAKKSKKPANTPKYDIWDEANKPKPTFEEEFQLVEKMNPRVIEAPSTRAAIDPTEVTHLSYNPSYEDHQDSLGIVLARKMKSIETRKRLERGLNGIKEIRIGKGLGMKIDGQGQEPEDEAEQVTTTEAATVENPKGQKQAKEPKPRSTLVEKRRERQRKLKKFEHDLVRVKSIAKAVERELKQKEEAKKVRAEMEKDAPLKTKKLGPYWFVEKKSEYLLTNELPEHLKDLQAQGNLFEDRFKSLQKRNMIEPRRRVKKVVARRKRYIEGQKDQKAREMQDQINLFRKNRKMQTNANDI